MANDIPIDTEVGYEETKFMFAFGIVSKSIQPYDKDDISEYLDISLQATKWDLTK